jgi:dolichyl-phosphate beta-glucosyltransferase
MTLELTIVVPAFNEAHRLSEGIKRFDAAVGDGAVDIRRTELLIVDDGSTDTTSATARSLLTHLPHHRVVRHPVNRGKGAAVRTGVSHARSTYTAYMDADMAIDPRAIPRLLDGSVMGRLFNRCVTTGTGLGLNDTQCGFKAFHTSVARLLFHLVRIDRFAFDVEVLVRAHRLGLRITEVPVQWTHVPGSTVHPLHDSISMLADVSSSRLGLLATPAVPGVVVRDPSGTSDPRVLAETIRSVLAGSTAGAPAAVVTDGPAAVLLLPLVDPWWPRSTPPCGPSSSH